MHYFARNSEDGYYVGFWELHATVGKKIAQMLVFLSSLIQVNTERAEFLSQGMNHVEGGWPKDINPSENDQTMRFRKKIEKDDTYVHSVLGLCQVKKEFFYKKVHVNLFWGRCRHRLFVCHCQHYSLYSLRCDTFYYVVSVLPYSGQSSSKH